MFYGFGQEEPSMPVPPCPATTPTTGGGSTEWVEHKGRCEPKYLYTCPSSFPAMRVTTGSPTLCVNPDAPNVPGVAPTRVNNPVLRKPYLFYGIVVAVVGIGYFAFRKK